MAQEKRHGREWRSRVIGIAAILLLLLVAPAGAATTIDLQIADSGRYIGYYNSLALDAAGNPHISYYDQTNEELKYATWNGAAWITTTVDSTGIVGDYTSLALDAAGNPRISYYDWTNRAVKYAAWDGAAWALTIVDNAGLGGGYTSLALDAAGNPRISYYDSDNYDQKYAAWNGAAWTVTTVDSEGDVGQYNSLALDAFGYPRISYFDSTNYNLKYAAWNGAAWTITTVDSEGSVGYTPSLALDAAGNPRISYFDNTNHNLKYAAWDGTAWTLTTVDSDTGVGHFSSLALDAAGNPCISYSDFHYYDQKYAAWNGTAWIITVVDNVGNVGGYNSLALDAAGNPRISYTDTTNDYLKYARLWSVNSNFMAAPLAGTPPLSVSFTDLSTGGATSWVWDFGDGGSSGAQNPVHPYTTAGTYTVSLTAVNGPATDTFTRTGYISVAPPVTADFTASATSGTAPLTVVFNDISTGSPDTWAWNFGSYHPDDGGVSSSQNAIHNYTGTGMFSVTLTAGNAGSTNTTTKVGYINVTAPPLTPPPIPPSPSTGSSGGEPGMSDSDYGPSPAAVPSKTTDLYFKVNSNYLARHKVTPADITIMSYGISGWQALPTTFVYSSGNDFYFAADANEYSLLAIGNKNDGSDGLPVFATDSVMADQPRANTNSETAYERTESVQQPAPGPVPRETSAVPAPAAPGTGFPFATVALIGAGCVVVAGSGLWVRRWWIRRQNPALFADYDD